MTDLAALARALAPLIAAELAPLLSADRPRTEFRTDLPPLLNRIWERAGGTSTWTVNELARLGLVDPRSTQQVGRDLFRQFQCNPRVGPFVLRRGDREHDGRTWSLERPGT